MVRTGGITRCRPDALVLLSDQFIIPQCFGRRITPVPPAYALMQQFSICLGETVCQGLQHDLAVIVMLAFKPFDMLLYALYGHGECTDIVLVSRFGRGNEISQGDIGLPRGFPALLAQEFQMCPVIQAHRVPAVAVAGPEADHRPGLKPVLAGHGEQHLFGIVIQFRGFGTHDLVGQYVGEPPVQFPGNEKGSPVNIGDDVRYLFFAERPCTGEGGRGRTVGGPIDLQFVLQGRGIVHHFLGRLLACKILTHPFVFLIQLLHEIRLAVPAQQLAGHVNASRGIQHMHHLPVVLRADLDRGMRF